MRYNTLEQRYPNIILLLALFLSFYYNLGSVALFNLDEGAFSEATREMVESGNYLTTYLNGALRFDKPILIYWLQAFSVHIFGLGEFALRLPSALSATLWVVVLYWFTKEHFDRYIAFMAAFMMATALQVSIIAKASIADGLLNLLIASSMFLFYLYYTRRHKLYLYGLFGFIALGVLTKGPVAILVPLAVTFIFMARKRELGLWLRMVFNPLGIVIFAVVALPWYILEYLDQGELFINGFFFKHNINRFNTSLEGHSGSLFYFIPVALVGLMPYTTLFVRAIRDIKSWFADDLHQFLIIWFLFVFLFFSLSGTKLPHYVIYGYTPLFILMARSIAKVRSDLLLLLPPLILFIILLVLPLIAPFVEPMVRHPFAKDILHSALSEFGWVWYGTFALLIALVAYLIRSRSVARDYKLFTIGILTAIAVNAVVMPTYAHITQEPIKQAALIAKEHNYTVHMWQINTPSFMLYSQKLTLKTKPKAGEILFTKSHKLKAFAEYEVLYQKHGVTLAKIVRE